MTRRAADDDGVYAILYGILLLAILGIAALVVDLGQLRQSRRESRLAADSAAVFAARDLDVVTNVINARQACTDAWSYLGTNLGFTVPGSTGCTAFPTSLVGNCPGAAILYSPVTVGDYTVRITWPVVDTDALMTHPNVQPATTTQAIDPNVDGTNACARIGVTVVHTDHPAFAGVFGTGDVTTAVSSVARSTTNPGKTGAIAALNVLDKTHCQVIQTAGGTASIEVGTVTDTDGTVKPGIISVESAGSSNGSDCNSSSKYVIQAATNQPASYIRADGPSGLGTGTILSYALNGAPTGNPAKAYELLAVQKGNLAPAPSVLGTRSGTTPVTGQYGCDSGCAAPYITNLRAAYAPVTALSLLHFYAASPAPYNTLPFVPYTTCTINSGTVVMPAGNYYINCPGGLSIKGTLVFRGGNVVVNGSISLNSPSACFAVNVNTNTCPTVVNGDVSPKPTTESILYFQGNSSISRVNGAFFAPNTFTYMTGGTFQLGGGDGTVLMTNPRLTPIPSGCDQTCQDGRFYKGTLWNESGNSGSVTQSIGGQGSLFLRGVLFVPNSKFDYKGQAAQQQVGAQFWTDQIVNSGQGTLLMTPDPNDVFRTPLLGTALIR